MIGHSFFLIFLFLASCRITAEFVIKPKVSPFRPNEATGRLSLLALTSGYLASAAAAAFQLYRHGNNGTIPFLLGLGLFLAGSCGRVAAVRQLGTSYHQLIKTPSGGLVTSGIYSLVRHPLYTFFVMEMTGFLVISPNIFTLLALILVIVAVAVRIRKEDILLAETFGPVFEEYRRTTKRCIPFIL